MMYKHVALLCVVLHCWLSILFTINEKKTFARKQQPFKAPTFKAWKKHLGIFWFSIILYKKEVCTLFPQDKRICHSVSSLIVVCPSILPLTKKHINKKNKIIAATIEHFNFLKTWKHTSMVYLCSNILYRRKVNTLKILCRCLQIVI